jgi:hypothetical protein
MISPIWGILEPALYTAGIPVVHPLFLFQGAVVLLVPKAFCRGLLLSTRLIHACGFVSVTFLPPIS